MSDFASSDRRRLPRARPHKPTMSNKPLWQRIVRHPLPILPVPHLFSLAQPFTSPLPIPASLPLFFDFRSLPAHTALHTSHAPSRKTARRSTTASAATPRTTATPAPSPSAPTTRPRPAPPATAAAPRCPRRPAPSAAASTPPRPLRRTRPHSSGAAAAAAAAGTTGMAETVWGTVGMVGGS